MDKKRPVILIVAVVLGIILGGLGVLAGCMGVFSTAMQGSMMEMQEQMAQGNPALQAQLGPQRAIIEAQAAFQIPMMVGQFLNVIASLLLIVGAAMLGALKRSGAMLVIGAAVACLIVDLYNGALGLYMSVQMQAAIEASMAQMGSMPGQDPAVFGAIMNASSTIGIVMAVFMIVVKMVVYAIDIWAARDADVQASLS